ncbi:hypothetical protein NM688_g3157 [Phlebia brevispora]|uniref:Uncharacterized protein n=1 Tax=Phlebia brevispora TaxID=194682 RepID=A0ACC1T6P5_9APHY|nr:hypothetical protein NM688_g3157 [Phlebia brevispora]
MDIDSDIDIKAMSNFVKGMSAEGSRQVTMDDLADAELIRQEDDDDDDDDGSDEDEDDGEVGDEMDVMQEEEAMLVAEAAQSSSSSEDEDLADEETPRRGFYTRLQRMRKQAEGKRPAKAEAESSDDDDDDPGMELEEAWADRDESFIEKIQALVGENEEMLSRKDREMRDKLFLAIKNGDFDDDDYEEFLSRPARRNKDKYKDLPPELQEQWEKDREKKAENKRKRAEERLLLAADPLAKKKGGKKGMKDALRAARLDDSIEIPDRIVDLVTLEQQIRRFLADLGGRKEMVLPPCDKETRKRVHELAEAFSLKSKSKGKGSARYTTLIKTTMSGVRINERKIGRIMRTEANWIGPDGNRNGKKVYSLAKHQEGEEVGKAAPKIGETNVGFKMLAAMGWAEGERIGLSGGLDAPITAKMKKTKLGLGATL